MHDLYSMSIGIFFFLKNLRLERQLNQLNQCVCRNVYHSTNHTSNVTCNNDFENTWFLTEAEGRVGLDNPRRIGNGNSFGNGNNRNRNSNIRYINSNSNSLSNYYSSTYNKRKTYQQPPTFSVLKLLSIREIRTCSIVFENRCLIINITCSR